MRSVRIVAAVVVALGAVVLVRLGEALTQLRAIDLPLSARAALSTDVAMDERHPRSTTAQSQPATAGREMSAGTGQTRGEADERPAADQHIARWLLADPEFARAADELLHDPDVQVQNEARRFLRDLGASVPEPSAEPVSGAPSASAER